MPLPDDLLSAALAEIRDLISTQNALIERMRTEAVGIHVFNASQDRLAERVPRLLAAVDAVLALHKPEDEVIYTACAAHVITGPSGRDPLRFDKMASCPDCRRRTVPTCSHCEHVDEWPCPTYEAIARELTGKDKTDG